MLLRTEYFWTPSQDPQGWTTRDHRSYSWDRTGLNPDPPCGSWELQGPLIMFTYHPPDTVVNMFTLWCDLVQLSELIGDKMEASWYTTRTQASCDTYSSKIQDVNHSHLHITFATENHINNMSDAPLQHSKPLLCVNIHTEMIKLLAAHFWPCPRMI